MNTAETVFAVIGILVIIGGFVYGIYDTYFQKEPAPHADKETTKL